MELNPLNNDNPPRGKSQIRPIDQFLALFQGVKPAGENQWLALCPAHADKKQSLSIKVAGDKILLKCHAGCKTPDILKTKNLTMADLYLNKPEAPREIVATYPYHSAQGELLFEVVKFEPKGFAQRRIHKGEYVWNLKGVKRVLYRLPEVITGISNNQTIYVVEGEKDVDNLRKLGFVATTNPMGAGKWRNTYSEALRGADVVIMPDNDDPGRAHAEGVAKGLYPVAARVRVLHMPQADISDVSAWIAMGADRETLERAVSAILPWEPPKPPPDMPLIFVTDRFLREKVADTIAAVEKANNPPRIFQRSGNIVRIVHDDFGTPYIETLTENACRGFLDRAACYVNLNDKGKMVPLSAPPLNIVRDYMSLPDRSNLPGLLNIIEIPVLRSDGTIVTQPGYDKASRLYYEPAVGLNIPTVSDNPSQKELETAVALIQEPLIDFPFDSEASKTNALAVLITPVCRPMITGLVPLCLLDKPQPGTGAGLLSDVIASIATGRQAAMMAPPRTDEECEKRLGSILLQGQTIITIDNVEGYLYFASLAMLLTAQYFTTRILGLSKMVRLPNRGTYIVTGNNVKLGGDMARRCYLSRMDAREARPWMRDPKSFKYQRLIKWVKENRGDLLAAILTMVRAWIVAEKPIPEGLPPLGGYEDWTDTIGSILAHAGFSGFLGNLEFMYQQADIETPQWEGFLAAWQEKFGEEAVTTDQVVTSINEHDILADALPDLVNRDPRKINRSLGFALRRRIGVRYPNGLMVNKNEKLVHNVAAWQVVNYREEAEKRGVRGVSASKMVSYKSDTKGGLGGLASHPTQETGKNKNIKKEEYKNGWERNPPNPLLATAQIQNPNPPFSEDLWAGMPDFPHECCPTCGGTDFWPDFENKRFVCGRCHPQPPQIDMEI